MHRPRVGYHHGRAAAADERRRLWLALYVIFAHIVPHSAANSVLPQLLLPLVGDSGQELARLIGTLALVTSAASLIIVPLLSAASDGYWGRKNVLLVGLAIDVTGELLLALPVVRSSRWMLFALAPVRAISASVMPMCHAAASGAVASAATAATVPAAAAAGGGGLVGVEPSSPDAREHSNSERFGAVGAAINAVRTAETASHAPFPLNLSFGLFVCASVPSPRDQDVTAALSLCATLSAWKRAGDGDGHACWGTWLRECVWYGRPCCARGSSSGRCWARPSCGSTAPTHRSSLGRPSRCAAAAAAAASSAA
jgi:hypothetical protein